MSLYVSSVFIHFLEIVLESVPSRSEFCERLNVYREMVLL